jgi:hypothetical protein
MERETLLKDEGASRGIYWTAPQGGAEMSGVTAKLPISLTAPLKGMLFPSLGML